MHGVPGSAPVLGAAARGHAGRGRRASRAGDTVARDRRRAGARPGRTLRWRAAAAGACSASARASSRCATTRGRSARRARSTCARHRPTTWTATALRALGLRRYRPPLEPVIGSVVAGGAARARRAQRRRSRSSRSTAQPRAIAWDDAGRAVQRAPGRAARVSASSAAAQRSSVDGHARSRGEGGAHASAASAPRRRSTRAPSAC